MGLLRVEAEKLSNNQLIAGVIEEIIDRDELFALLPFSKIDGKALVYNRENTISEGDFLDVSSANSNNTVPEGAATFTEITAKLRILAGDVDVDKFLDATMSDTTNQRAIQIAAKAKALARKFRRTLAIGNSGNNALEFDGVATMNPGGQTIYAGDNGAAITFTMLDELLDAVPYGADAIMMRSGTLRAFRVLLRALGGTVPESVMIKDFGMVPAHNGVPIIVNDFLPGNETRGSNSATCSIYALRLNEVDGMHGIYGGDTAGIAVEDIGTLENKDATRTRVKWYCGTALRSSKSIARLAGVTSI